MDSIFLEISIGFKMKQTRRTLANVFKSIWKHNPDFLCLCLSMNVMIIVPFSLNPEASSVHDDYMCT